MSNIENSAITLVVLPMVMGIMSGLAANVIWSNPILAIVVTLGVVFITLVGIWVIRRYNERQVLGKMRFYPVFSNAHGDILKSCKESTTINIVAIRGIHIFESDLYSTILKSSIHTKSALRILLLDPQSPPMQNYLHHTVPSAQIPAYVSRWQAVTAKLLHEREYGLDISLRVYKDPPLWKLIVTNKHCFFIGYTDDRRGHSLPLIRVDNASNCFAIALSRYFEDLWTESTPIS